MDGGGGVTDPCKYGGCLNAARRPRYPGGCNCCGDSGAGMVVEDVEVEQRGNNVRGNPERAGRYVPPTTTAGGPGMLELCFSAG